MATTSLTIDNVNTDVTLVTIDDSMLDAAARLAVVWEDSAASVTKRAQAARKLASIDGVTQAIAADLLKRAIAAARVAQLPAAARDVASVDAIAETIKISASAISQYLTALERAELICDTHGGGRLDNALVREFYRAATSHVKAATLKQIVAAALECDTIKSRIELAVEYLLTAQSDAGIARVESRTKRAAAGDGADGADGAGSAGSGTAGNSGTVTRADILAALASMAERADNPNAKRLIGEFGAALLGELGI